MTKPTADEVAALRPDGGWAGVKLVVLPAALFDPATIDRDDEEPYSRFSIPGQASTSVGDVFSLSEDEARRFNVEAWLRSGNVGVYRPRAAKAKETPAKDAD